MTLFLHISFPRLPCASEVDQKMFSAPRMTWDVNHMEYVSSRLLLEIRLRAKKRLLQLNPDLVGAGYCLCVSQHFSRRADMPRLSTFDQTTEERLGLCGRFGQHRLVIRNPMLAHVWLKQVFLVMACATNSQRRFPEPQRDPCRIDRHDRVPVLIGERSDHHIGQLERPAKRSPQDEKDLHERCWIQTIFFR